MDLIKQYEDQFNFIPGGFFMWSPYDKTIMYDQRRIKTQGGRLGLLHEICHGLLNHKIYKYDIELINMEMDAWELTRKLAGQYGIKVNEAHIASCIDTYDTWLSRRATCPDCKNFSLQKGRDSYGCFVCGSEWTVNWRKDRRVKRTITYRYEPPTLSNASA
ncbi:MAG TPA: hypothetical protein VNA68_02560 [Candidatus Dormibacteraeota bacterium]|nr:hypothetical protein [Candidatus Dormibacteraeota bacterium]